MDNRTIVNLQLADLGDAEEIRFWLDSAPVVVPSADIQRRFGFSSEQMPDWTSDAAVREHGLQLVRALREHPAIKSALANLLQTPPNQTHNLFFHLVCEDAERFHWEALCDENGAFLALDSRWPIARMAKSVAERPPPANREFLPPLRMTAMLSAAGISAIPEWQRLKDAVNQARAAGLAIALTVLVGEEELLDEIQAEIDAGALPDTEVDTIRTRGELEQAIMRSEPHILHFFCHGAVSHQRRLMLANFQDWLEATLDDGPPTSSVQLPINDLINLEAVTHAWMVTLNCCEGAKAANGNAANQTQQEELHSMVRDLVANGVPAAVGMLEPIDAADAHAFCAGFYGALFENVRKIALDTPAGNEVEVNWARALRQARLSVLSRHEDNPEKHRQWTVPALYVRPERFRLQVTGGAGDLAGAGAGGARMPDPVDIRRFMVMAQEVASALQALPPGTPNAVRQRLLTLLNDVPSWMHPDANGAFA